MNHTELDITSLIRSEEFVSFDLSNNRATLGDDAGRLTWNASMETAREVVSLIPTPEHKDEFRDFVRSSGGWTREEIAAWSDTELDALLLQWIAGDIREAFGDADFADWDWAQYETDASEGRISSRLFKADDGRVFFSISN